MRACRDLQAKLRLYRGKAASQVVTDWAGNTSSWKRHASSGGGFLVDSGLRAVLAAEHPSCGSAQEASLPPLLRIAINCNSPDNTRPDDIRRHHLTTPPVDKNNDHRFRPQVPLKSDSSPIALGYNLLLHRTLQYSPAISPERDRGTGPVPP